MAADDERIGRALRELRRRAGQTQAQAAASAGVSRRTWERAELGGCGQLTLDTLRKLGSPFDARLRATIWWRGAELDRLLDERHARLVEQVIALFRRRGWLTAAEVSFSEYGERGSLDLLGFHLQTRSAAVGEVKTAFGSFEETNRRLDVKVRLAPKLVSERFGQRPATVSRLLILPNEMTLRRVAARHPETLLAIYPARAQETRAWLTRPVGSISALWFLSDVHERATD